MGVTSKMLIAEIIRMYDLFDGEIAAERIRETGAIKEKIRNRLSSYFYAQLLAENATTCVFNLQKAIFIIIPTSQ